jgi:hypothetical protein
VAGAAPSAEAQPPETGNFLASCLLFSARLAGDSFPSLIHFDLFDAAIGVGAVAGDSMEVDLEQLLLPAVGTTFSLAFHFG